MLRLKKWSELTAREKLSEIASPEKALAGAIWGCIVLTIGNVWNTGAFPDDYVGFFGGTIQLNRYFVQAVQSFLFIPLLLAVLVALKKANLDFDEALLAAQALQWEKRVQKVERAVTAEIAEKNNPLAELFKLAELAKNDSVKEEDLEEFIKGFKIASASKGGLKNE